MKLVHQFDLELNYEGEVLPVGGEGDSLQFHGMGIGRVHGNDLNGTVEFENAPFLTGGVFAPNLKAVIRFDTGESLKLQCRGFSLPPRGGEPDHRRFSTFVEFHSVSPRFKWLKTAIGLQEGTLHVTTRQIFSRVFTIENDMPLSLA